MGVNCTKTDVLRLERQQKKYAMGASDCLIWDGTLDGGDLVSGKQRPIKTPVRITFLESLLITLMRDITIYIADSTNINSCIGACIVPRAGLSLCNFITKNPLNI